jgi:uncharacterized membrane protein YagU involved in acid resistance
MSFGHAVLWGFISTLVLTSLMAAAQGLRLTRMNLPLLLGTTLTPDRDRAMIIGFAIHFLNGWAFTLVYVAVFQSWGSATWWQGAGIGLVQALVSLLTLIPLMPAVHPRMASEQRGPTPTRQLEPPGFLALNYGRGTPLSFIVAHVIYGSMLGGFYEVL